MKADHRARWAGYIGAKWILGLIDAFHHHFGADASRPLSRAVILTNRRRACPDAGSQKQHLRCRLQRGSINIHLRDISIGFDTAEAPTRGVSITRQVRFSLCFRTVSDVDDMGKIFAPTAAVLLRARRCRLAVISAGRTYVGTRL